MMLDHPFVHVSTHQNIMLHDDSLTPYHISGVFRGWNNIDINNGFRGLSCLSGTWKFRETQHQKLMDHGQSWIFTSFYHVFSRIPLGSTRTLHGELDGSQGPRSVWHEAGPSSFEAGRAPLLRGCARPWMDPDVDPVYSCDHHQDYDLLVWLNMCVYIYICMYIVCGDQSFSYFMDVNSRWIISYSCGVSINPVASHRHF